jgi:hypothetical protein
MPGDCLLLQGNHAVMLCRYDERTELADYADIRAVPSFQFYMNGKLVEQFATRDKAKISLAIDKYVPGAVSL